MARGEIDTIALQSVESVVVTDAEEVEGLSSVDNDMTLATGSRARRGSGRAGREAMRKAEIGSISSPESESELESLDSESESLVEADDVEESLDEEEEEPRRARCS